MTLPIQVTFRDFPHSPALEQVIKEKASKLESLFDKISYCRVVIGIPHRHHHKGHLYQVNLDIGVPGKDIVVQRRSGRLAAKQDAYSAIRDAFEAGKRQLQAYLSRRH